MKQKRNLEILLVLLLAGIVFGVSCSPALAGGTGGLTGTIDNPAPDQLIDVSDFGVLLKNVIVQIFLEFAAAIAVVFLIIGGFQYVSSRGNEEAMEKAKKTITAAVIGIVVIVMAYAIVAIVNNLVTSLG